MMQLKRAAWAVILSIGIVVVWAAGVGYSNPPTMLATIGMVGTPPKTELPSAAPAPVFPQLQIRINIPATRLEIYKDGELAKTYPVSVGAPGFKSPVMQNTLTTLVWNPSWIPPDSPWAAGEKPAPPGPNNPLGPVKMPLEQGIRIHGTNKSKSIGRAASHGCFRMYNNDAADLAWFIQQHASDKADDSYRATYAKNRYRTHVVKLLQPVSVDIVYEPVEVANKMLTIHPDLYGWGGNRRENIITLVSAYGITEEQIHPTFWQRVKIGGKKGSQKIPLEEIVTPPDENRHLDKD